MAILFFWFQISFIPYCFSRVTLMFALRKFSDYALFFGYLAYFQPFVSTFSDWNTQQVPKLF